MIVSFNIPGIYAEHHYMNKLKSSGKKVFVQTKSFSKNYKKSGNYSFWGRVVSDTLKGNWIFF